MSTHTAGAGAYHELTELLVGWLGRQRWFLGTDPDHDVQLVAGLPLALPPAAGTAAGDDPTATAPEVVALLVEVAGVTYQVPLSVHATAVPGLDAALIATVDRPDGRRWVYDGPHDPVFVRALLHVLAQGSPTSQGSPASQVSSQVQGHAPDGGLPVDPVAPGQVLRGEQSNTSIVVGATSAHPLIVKLFRVIAPGRNPDVVIQGALAAAGSPRVPRPAGWVKATWLPRGADQLVSADLAFACEFLPGSQDAWRVALEAVDDGVDFTGPARALGEATAELHRVLATVMPRVPATEQLLGSLADALVARVDWAVAAAPALQPYALAARRAVDAVRHVRNAPDLQQVHGDYHLGQVLHSPVRGWVVLDFEGEPLRPLAERMRPDLALRDVAGMVRSFDYAARHATADLPDNDPAAIAAQRWSAQARAAFLAGYTTPATTPAGSAALPAQGLDEVLLRALELDKALYEVVYELVHRPTWVSIPLAAVQRLLST